MKSLIAFALIGTATLAAATEQEPSSSGVLEDRGAALESRAHCDARELRVSCEGAQVACSVRMEKPLIEGMFTCVELWIDCDANPETGREGGFELRVRAAVGSRFQPNAAKPTNGTRKPIDHTRSSGTVLEDNGAGEMRWVHRMFEARPPQVKGAEISFRFPRSLVEKRSGRYQSKFTLRAVVHTSCSDQPIELLHACSDEGLPIQVDGDVTEWSGVATRDPGDEMHPATRYADLTSLRLDHSDDALFASVTFAETGFAMWEPDVDVQGRPAIVLHIEPLFPRYQSPETITLVAGKGEHAGMTPEGDWRAVFGERCCEVSVPRAGGQNRLRVIARSAVVYRDWFEGSLALDWGAK